MFKAGLEFALGLGAGCVLLYAAFLCVSFIWFGIDQRLFERSRRQVTEGPSLVRPQITSDPPELPADGQASSTQAGVSAG
jgi:hypothetical protein